MEIEKIEHYIELRQELTDKKWRSLEALYAHYLDKKKRQLTDGVTLDSNDLDLIRVDAQKL